MAAYHHRHSFMNTGANHVPNCRTPEVMEYLGGKSRCFTCFIPGIPKIFDWLPFAVKNKRTKQGRGLSGDLRNLAPDIGLAVGLLGLDA